jgi:histone deacetylase 1/2
VKITKYRLDGKRLVGWMCQTGVAVGMDLEDKMPYNEYYEYFGPDYTLHVTPSNMENQNSRSYLDTIRWTS